MTSWLDCYATLSFEGRLA